MGASVGAAMKRVAVTLLSDRHVVQKLLFAVVVLIVAVFTPIVAVVTVFNGSVEIDWDRLQTLVVENLSAEERERLQFVETTMTSIETQMTDAELDAHAILEAQVLYVLALSDYAHTDHFVETLVQCFAAEQTEAQLIAAVNAAFGTSLSADDFSKLMASISPGIVAVAASQLGNVGGQPYWSWYGFESRVEWCACFVSWCANECGFIERGIVPQFSYCPDGVNWFRTHDQWLDRNQTPTPGMIIFFDWARNGQDGTADHVGIVSHVENGTVYTIEGNSGDACRERQYAVGYYEILGYGTYTAVESEG